MAKPLGRREFFKGLALGVAATGLVEFSWSTEASEKDALWVYNPSGVRQEGVFVDEFLKKTMDEQKITKPPLAAQFPRLKVERIQSGDPFTVINSLFYERGWTDGLPIIPPTENQVRKMLKGTDLAPEEVVAVLDPMKGQATVSKIAANAVMAGCRPEYMPILIAAVQIVADPAFNLLGVATTTNPDTPLIIVNGPIAKQLDINSGTNALGRGWRANATIGRALHLIIQNIGGSWPGVTDMSTLGHPGEFANCLAENEEKNPWGPLHVELGYAREANVVTVVAAEGIQSILGSGWDSEGYLSLVSDHLAALDRSYRPVVLLFIAQDTAAMLKRDGFTKDKIREFIYEHGRIQFSKYKKRFIDTKKVQGVPNWILKTEDPNAMIPVPIIDFFLIGVAGGPGEKSMLVPVWGGSSKVISKKVQLPSNWEDLLTKKKTHKIELDGRDL
ncbi:MAG: hypothetical protein ACE144_19700 [Thermodesulfobacteriota bacterium]